MQHRLASIAQNAMTSFFNTKVEVKSITLLYPFGLKATDLVIYDRNDSVMLDLPHFEARFNPIELINHRIAVYNVRLRQPYVNFYTQHTDSAANYGFLLKSGNGAKTNNIFTLRVNAVNIVNGTFRYNDFSQPYVQGYFSKEHINAEHINANVSVKALSKDTININCRSVSAKEQSGLNLHSIRGSLTYNKDRIELNQFRVVLENSNLGIERFYYNKMSKEVEFSLSSAILPCEFSPFVKQLETFTEPIDLYCNLSGTTDSLMVNNLDFFTGHNTVTLSTNGIVTNILNTDSLGFDMFSSNLKTSPQFDAYISSNLAGFDLNIPHQVLSKLGKSTCLVELDGNIATRCNFNILINSGLANMDANIYGNRQSAKTDIFVDGLDLYALTSNKDFSNASFTLNFDLAQMGKFDTTMYGEYHGNIISLGYKDYIYRDIATSGHFDTHSISTNIMLDDVNASLALCADYKFPSNRTSNGKLEFDLEKLDLKQLNLISQDKEPLLLSGKFYADLAGSNIEDITGNIFFNDWTIVNATDSMHIDSVYICSEIKDERCLRLESDFTDLELKGQYLLSTLPYSLLEKIRESLPDIYEWSIMRTAPSITPDNNCTLRAWLRPTLLYEKTFKLPLHNQDATLVLNIDDANQTTSLDINIEQAKLNNTVFNDVVLKALADKHQTSIDLDGNILISDDNSNTVNLSVVAADNTARGVLNWDNSVERLFKGSLDMQAEFDHTSRNGMSVLETTVNIDTTDIFYKGTAWNFRKSEIAYRNKALNFKNFGVKNNQEHLDIDGALSSSAQDTVIVRMANLNLDEWFRLFNLNNIPLGGIATGNAFASQVISKEPAINADINLKDFVYLNSYGGNAALTAKWNNQSSRIDCALSMNNNNDRAYITGYYSPRTDSLEFDINANHVNADFLNYFTYKVMDDVQGYATGLVTLFGTIGNFNLKGNPIIQDTKITPAFVNTSFYVDYDTLFMERDFFNFTNVDFRDAEGHKGILDCRIYHHNLHNMALDLTANINGVNGINFNQEKNPISANVYANGIFHFRTGGEYGRGLYLSGDLSTAPGTTFSYNFNSGNLINDSFLTIIPRGTPHDSVHNNTNRIAVTPTRTSKKWLDIDINADITDNADISFYMNNINCQLNSTGHLNVQYDPLESINMTGVLGVTHGTCNMSLQNIIRKDFTIMENSQVHFNGPPTKAELEVHAYHMVNSASLYDISMDVNNSNLVRVRCLMDIIGVLTSPEISVNLELPQGSAEEQEILAGAITTDEQRNTQFMSLLTLGKFINPDMNSTQSDAATSNVSAITKATVNSQINNMLGNIFNSNVLSLSSNLSTDALTNNTLNTNREYEGIVEAHLLNNRLLINGNFGYRENNLMGTSDFIGDVEVQFRVVPKIGLSLLGYNRNNNRYFTKTALNTQGIGVMFEKEFK